MAEPTITAGTVISVTLIVLGTIAVVELAAVVVAGAAGAIADGVEKKKEENARLAALARHRAAMDEKVTATVDAEGRIHSVG